MGQAVGVGSGLNDVAAESKSIDNSRTQARVGERLRPRSEAVVGGDGHAVLLFALGQHLEQQFSSATV
jgi:hypothetical protein